LIPTRAEALASRVSTTIELLFGLLQPQDMSDMSVSSTLREYFSTLSGMFSAALRIKTKALVSKAVLEVILPPYGTMHDSDLMRVEPVESGTGDLRPQKIREIQTCVAPGLKRYERNEGLVDYNSFCKPGGGPSQPSEVITKAVVIIV
jgi:hypothetical protein